MASTGLNVGQAAAPKFMLSTLRRSHEAFAASRRFAHVPRAPYLKQLDQHVASTNSSLLVRAPSGAGKSALVSYWAEEYRKANPDLFIVEHYVGSGEEGSNHLDVIRRVMLEIREKFSVTAEPPSTPEALVKAFPTWLWYVREPTVIILDALDQLHHDSYLLTWLPEAIPPTVHLIVTANDGGISAQLTERNWEVLTLKPFTLAERRGLVQRFVEGKKATLTAAQQRAVVSDAGSSNPLLLRTRLEEARKAVSDRNVDEAITYYLGAETLEEMYSRVLLRMERELEFGTAQKVLSLLWGAKGGLAIEEIVEITGLTGEQVSKVIGRLEAYLLRTEKRFTLFHLSLKKAAEERWLTSPSDSAAIRLRLADYFQAAPHTLRSIQELLYQLSEASLWWRLVQALTDIPIFLQCFEHLQYELLRYWQRLDSSVEFTVDVEKEYEKGLKDYGRTASPEELMRGMKDVGKLLEITGRMEGAEKMYRGAHTLAVELGDEYWRAILDFRLGSLAAARGEYEAGEKFLEEALEIMRRTRNRKRIALVTSDLGKIAFYRGDFLRAERFFQASLEEAEREKEAKDITRILQNLGVVYGQLGQLEKGAESFRRMLNFAEQRGDIVMETAAVANLGVVAEKLGNLEESYEMFKRSRDLAAAVGDKAQLSMAHGNLGSLLIRMHRSDEALEQFRAQQRLAEEMNDRQQLAAAWGNIGMAQVMSDEYEGAAEGLDRSLKLYRRIGDSYGVGLVYGRLGYLHLRRDDSLQALKSFRKEGRVAEQIGNRELSMESLLGLGHAYRIGEKLNKAEEYYRALGEMATEAGHGARGVEATGWLGVVASRRGEFNAALQQLESAVKQSRKEHPSEDLAHWLLEKASLLLYRAGRRTEVITAASAKKDVTAAQVSLYRVREMAVCKSDKKLRGRAEELFLRLNELQGEELDSPTNVDH